METIPLSKKESKILGTLVASVHQPTDRAYLLQESCENEGVITNPSLDSSVRILNVHGRGYKIGNHCITFFKHFYSCRGRLKLHDTKLLDNSGKFLISVFGFSDFSKTADANWFIGVKDMTL
jgi:hypothetical protein